MESPNVKYVYRCRQWDKRMRIYIFFFKLRNGPHFPTVCIHLFIFPLGMITKRLISCLFSYFDGDLWATATGYCRPFALLQRENNAPLSVAVAIGGNTLANVLAIRPKTKRMPPSAGSKRKRAKNKLSRLQHICRSRQHQGLCLSLRSSEFERMFNEWDKWQRSAIISHSISQSVNQPAGQRAATKKCMKN